ncbi:hypothetical protein Nepgr_020704 [Nepenthes gracilis]|uniref:Major facilitator superfamily (MFS) profile domain-containing protein n=1 Tax=Nepenthes gracilis TaxID=150966 RepID=A0AAD3SWN8_NEPGR|nr:hypothetical protein Nepgr_020704 [Nepenthes gracilis]
MRGTVPGYWFAIAFIDIIGRFWIQLMGFFFMTVFMFALSFPYHHWQKKGQHIGFIVMYCLTFFFANFGPNTTTFVVPAEIFPARLRSTYTAYLLRQAGAYLLRQVRQGQSLRDPGFLYLSQEKSLIVLGVLSFIGMVFTLLVPESKGMSLEEAACEADVEDDELGRA